MMEHELIKAIRYNVLQGRRNKDDEGLEDDLVGQPGVAELVKEALVKGLPVKDILLYGLTEGMNEVGKKFEKKEYFIPDMLSAAEAVGTVMDILEPHLQNEGTLTKGKFLLATVEKDQHDIGKNIVGIMLKGAGFQVIDLGISVPADDIVRAVESEKPNYLGLSALLNTTMSYMQHTINLLQEKGMRSNLKILIGGAPTSPEFAAEIGADAHCKDAFAAVSTANKYASTNRGQDNVQ